ncbi:MAG TPA: hypothetical protein VFX50_16315, partial [Gemmatimonadales bacterium]|nr:hypothetical protein [Gemmatimonadales bacterium]
MRAALPRLAGIGAAALVAAGCQPSYERTGERALPSPRGVELAVVQVLVNIPLRYAGLHHTVVCRSPNTAGFPGDAKDGVPPGWSTVGHLASIDGQEQGMRGKQRAPARAAALAKAEALVRESLLSGPGWVAWRGESLQMSFDGCATWRRLVPTEVLSPGEVDVPAGKQPCEPKRCMQLAFQSGHPVSFHNVRVERTGRITLRMRSTALRGSGERRVESRDGGKTWRVL